MATAIIRKTGKCKWFNVVKGYGFITPTDGSPDVFLHQTVIQMQGFRSLAEGEEVEYDCKMTDKGMEATFVCGPGGSSCKGSEKRPISKKKYKKLRCYNCGEFSNHVAAKCPKGPMPKRCHSCKSNDHLVAECPFKKSGERQQIESTSSSSNASVGASSTFGVQAATTS